MPRYDYECRDCGHVFEVKQSFHDEPLTDCPECEGSIRRVIAPVGIVFKGGGYYVTDTRGAEKSAAPAAESSSSDSSGEEKGASESASGASDSGTATSESKASESSAGAKSVKTESKASSTGSGASTSDQA